MWKQIKRIEHRIYQFWEMGLGLILPDGLWNFPLTGSRSEIDQ